MTGHPEQGHETPFGLPRCDTCLVQVSFLELGGRRFRVMHRIPYASGRTSDLRCQLPCRLAAPSFPGSLTLPPAAAWSQSARGQTPSWACSGAFLSSSLSSTGSEIPGQISVEGPNALYRSIEE